MELSIDLKRRLLEQSLSIIENRINNTKSAMDKVQDSANQESKSSAGDKYETGRAMMQLEKENLASQFQEAMKLKKTLYQINPEVKNTEIGLGSVAGTSIGNFFVAVSTGKIKLGDETYFTISLASPIGKSLQGRCEGDKIVFNGREVLINEVI